MEQVVKLTVYLTDVGDLEAFRRVHDEYISLDRARASSLMRVSGLVNPDFRGGSRSAGRDIRRTLVP